MESSPGYRDPFPDCDGRNAAGVFRVEMVRTVEHFLLDYAGGRSSRIFHRMADSVPVL